MIGPCLSSKGGITSVIQLYKTMGLMDGTVYIASVKDGSVFARAALFIKALLHFVQLLLFHPSINLVHMHVSQRGSVVRKGIFLLLSYWFGKKVLWHMHGSEFIDWYQLSSPKLQTIIAQAVSSADCIIALSEKRKTDLLSIIPTAKVAVVYNPALLQKAEQLSCFSTNTQNKTTPIRFLFMGRYGQRKGVFDLIDAVAKANNPLIHLQLYGDADVEAVSALVQKHKLQQQVFVGQWISGDDKHQVFLNADVLVLPSYNEGLPMAILEALSYGLPVISTPVGGIAEAVTDGFNGFLIPPGNVNALAEKLLYFVENPQQIPVMGQAGYHHAQQTFKSSLIKDQIQGVYHQLSV